MGVISRVVLIVAFGLASFFPTYGLVFLGYNAFPSHPVIIGVLALLWAIILVLILPLSQSWFRGSSTLMLAVVLGVGIFQGATYHWPTFEGLGLYTWAVVAVCMLLSWMMLATPLWRRVKGIVVTSQVHNDDGGHHA